jgi:hypothetical protein
MESDFREPSSRVSFYNKLWKLRTFKQSQFLQQTLEAPRKKSRCQSLLVWPTHFIVEQGLREITTVLCLGFQSNDSPLPSTSTCLKQIHIGGTSSGGGVRTGKMTDTYRSKSSSQAHCPATKCRALSREAQRFFFLMVWAIERGEPHLERRLLH